MAIVTSNFSAFANITEVVSANAQTAILAEIDKLRNGPLLQQVPKEDADDSHVIPLPYFDAIPEPARELLVAELDALKAAIDAAPTA